VAILMGRSERGNNKNFILGMSIILYVNIESRLQKNFPFYTTEIYYRDLRRMKFMKSLHFYDVAYKVKNEKAFKTTLHWNIQIISIKCNY
jgi:hypothetical protein